MQQWLSSYSTDSHDQTTVSNLSLDDEFSYTRDRVYNVRPTIPQSAEETSEVLLDKLEQAGRVPSKEKFRRMACNTFVYTGACPYNDRCVFLHDYRIKAEGVKVRTTRQSKTNSAIKDTFYWPDMTRRDIVRHLDQQGLPTANQIYVIPEAFKMNPANFHNRGLYSIWAHFVEFCGHNSIFYSKKYRDITSEPFFQVSAYRENPHVPGAKRMDVLVRLSMGKSICPASASIISLLPPVGEINRGNSVNRNVMGTKEPVVNALLDKQKRKTWSEISLKDTLPLDIKNGCRVSGMAPYPSPVGYDSSSFSPSQKSYKERSKSVGNLSDMKLLGFPESTRNDYNLNQGLSRIEARNEYHFSDSLTVDFEDAYYGDLNSSGFMSPHPTNEVVTATKEPNIRPWKASDKDSTLAFTPPKLDFLPNSSFTTVDANWHSDRCQENFSNPEWEEYDSHQPGLSSAFQAPDMHSRLTFGSISNDFFVDSPDDIQYQDDFIGNNLEKVPLSGQYVIQAPKVASYATSNFCDIKPPVQTTKSSSHCIIEAPANITDNSFYCARSCNGSQELNRDRNEKNKEQDLSPFNCSSADELYSIKNHDVDTSEDWFNQLTFNL